MTTQPVVASHPGSVPPAPRRGVPFFIAAALIFVAALVAGAIWSVLGLLSAWNAPDDFARTDLPGTVQVSVSDTGTQYLYYERTDGTAVPSLDELGVTVTGPDSESVTVRTTDFTMEYDADPGDLGTAFARFDATRTGTYTVSATADEPGATLAVGESVANPLVVPLVGSAALVGVGLLAAVVLVLLGLRRSSP